MVTFGSTTTFGTAPAPAATGGFSFGGTPAPAPAAGGGLFGSTPAPAPAPSTGFSFGSPAAAPAPSGGLFGSSTPAPAPSGGLFGAPAPAPSGGLFGTPAPAPAPGTSLFGAPAPAPSGGLFGTPAPAPSGGLFGTPAPAPSGGLFGAPAPAPSGGFFGAPAPAPSGGLFGNTSQNTTFGSPQPTSGNNQQAALIFAQQQEAQQRAEAERMEKSLMKLYAAYNTVNPTIECRFQHIFYDAADANIIYQYKMMGQRSHQPHVDPKVWAEAEAYNPDPEKYIPVSVVGSEQLQSRISSQQAKASKLNDTLKNLRESLASVKKGMSKSNTIAQTYEKDQERLMRNLLRTLRKVEVLRCMNMPTQSGEREFREKLNVVSKEMNYLNAAMQEVTKNAEKCKADRFIQENIVELSDDDHARISRALRDQKHAIEKLKNVARIDTRDVQIMKKELSQKLS